MQTTSFYSDLKKLNIEILLVANPDNIFYLTGFPLHNNTSGREAFLLICAFENLFITDGRLIGHAREVLPKKFTVSERTHSASMIRITESFLKKYKLKELAFEKNNLTVSELEKFQRELKGIKLIGTEGLIEKIRLIKNQEEINKIKKAAEITDKVFSTLVPLIRTGKTELELVWKIKTMFNEFGTREAFEPIVASGPGSAIPHYSPTLKKLQKGEMVLLDFGAKYKGYCSDMTRVVFLGKADNKARNIYNTVLKAQQESLKQLIKLSKDHLPAIGSSRRQVQAGKIISAKEIDKVARSYITKSGFPSFPHGLGHGVGIRVHEDPRLNPKGSSLLSEGMVFTIEPGIYLPGWGGIRIEDLVYWGDDGVEILSNSTKDLIEIL